MYYEQLIEEIEEEGIEVKEMYFNSPRIKGLCVHNTIALNSQLETYAEKMCVLAEEIGHYYTSTGNILDQSKIENRKQERRARGWGYEKLIPIPKLIEAYLIGARNRYELAEFLDVTESFLEDAINYYREKYGLYVKYGDYIVYFNPLAIYKRFEDGE